MTIFEKITALPETLGELLASLKVIDSPWEEAFHRAFCDSCIDSNGTENCDTPGCPHEAERNNPTWWLKLGTTDKTDAPKDGMCADFNVYLGEEASGGLLLEGVEEVLMPEIATDALARRPAEISRISIYPRIDELPEDLLDILAYDFKADWYDFEYPITAKRALIKGKILAHKRQGTVYATRSVLDSLYPKSAMEEWFTYGGEPGYFRLNVNVTDSATEGAVVIYSTEEILRRIATVKRLSVHLEGVSYMVRRGIIIKHRMDSWAYRVPECGTIRCGTWWMRHTLGWSERHRLTVGERVELFGISPELSGTLPVIKTPGYSLRAGLRVNGQADAYHAQPQEAGMIRSGTEWTRRTLGWSERAGALAASGRAEAYNALAV